MPHPAQIITNQTVLVARTIVTALQLNGVPRMIKLQESASILKHALLVTVFANVV